ncbi:MAG: hypothetical protein GXO71_05875 [Caldiserica bacterium]|nr:hypothetical protein [Caldisericota bacterium]
MKLILIILNQEELLDDILSALVEAGILGANVIESTRMTEILSHEVPIFAGLRQISKGGRSYNRIILAPVEEEEEINEFLHILEETGINLQKEETGTIFLLPAEKIP